MKARHHHRLTINGLLLTLLYLLLQLRVVHAQEYGIIDDVIVKKTAVGRQYQIRFTDAAQYIGHTPEKNGTELFIDLRLIGPAPAEQILPQQQQLRFHSNSYAPLSSVTYSLESNQRARLELNFSRSVSYEITTSSDFRGITILIPEERSPAETSVAVPVPAPTASPEIEKQAEALMNRARKAMLDERNFKRAIKLYQQVLDLTPNSHSRTALELLGLAQERIGQRRKAMEIYEGYLAQYPQGDGSGRVQQRLMSLVTATLPERPQLRKERLTGEEARWNVYGSLSQFYRHNTYSVDGVDTLTTTSALSTDLDMVAQRRSSRSDSRFRVTAGYFDDQLEDGPGDHSRVSSLYAEHHDRKVGWWTRAGRQSSSQDGVLGKFDGLKLGYALHKKLEATVVAGSPVISSRDDYNDTRQFTGAAINLGPFANSWEFTLYGIQQDNDSLVDREAAGGEFRFYKNNLIVLGLLDYDTFYDEPNIGMLLTNWTLANELTLNATIDVRKTPILTTQNALIGQTVTTLDELRQLYTEDTIYQLAKDRTAEARTFTFGVSKPLDKTLRLATDLTLLKTTATEASAGVPATIATDDEYFLNLQAISTGLIKGDDISTLGLRFSDTTTANGIGIYGSSRLPVGSRWHFYPRLRIDYREWKETTETQWTIGPIVRVEYRWGKVRLEAEYGGDWTDHELPDDDEKTTSTYGSIGYRYEF